MKTIQALLLVTLIVILSAACTRDPAQPKTVTIGIVNLTPNLEPMVEGFKAGLTETGYIEGKNVTYIYEGPTRSFKGLEPAVQKLLAEDVDLILAMPMVAVKQAQQAVAGTDIPVVFGAVYDPVKTGLVESLRRPGGNITGVWDGDNVAKALQWLLAVAPEARRIYVPHYPKDGGSVHGLVSLEKAAAAQGVQLTVVEVHTDDELVTAIEDIPANVQAVFILPSGLLGLQIPKFVKTAIEHRLSLMGAGEWYKLGVTLTYAFGIPQMGVQISQQATKILEGTSPSDIPVETPEFFLAINLPSAEASGLDIPDEVLDQADFIIRETKK